MLPNEIISMIDDVYALSLSENVIKCVESMPKRSRKQVVEKIASELEAYYKNLCEE